MSQEHPEFDGIQELDNPMPFWLSTLFLITVLYALGYAIVYPSFWFWPGLSHWTSTAVANQEEAEKMAARKAPVKSEHDLLELARDPVHLKNGKAVFDFSCVSCHGANAEGKIGPSLVDAEWKYGSTQEDILTTIRNGRPGGMPNWGTNLPPQDIEDVAAYVISLQKR